jgi:predicted small secreted protein
MSEPLIASCIIGTGIAICSVLWVILYVLQTIRAAVERIVKETPAALAEPAQAGEEIDRG